MMPRRRLTVGLVSVTFVMALLAVSPQVAAQTECAALADWGTDPEGDGWVVSGLNGALDIIAVRAGMDPADCTRMLLEVEVSESLLIDVAGVSNSGGGTNLLVSSGIRVDLTEAEGAPSDWSAHFWFREDLLTGNAALAADRVAILQGGTEVYNSADGPAELTVTETGTLLTASIDGSIFDVAGWTGFHAIAVEQVADTVGGVLAAVYTADDLLVEDVPWNIGCGFDCDGGGGDSPGIDITIDTDDPNGDAGTSVTVNGTATANRTLETDESYNVTFVVEVPDGWTGSVEPEVATIMGDINFASLTVTVNIPEGTPAGPYEVTIIAFIDDEEKGRHTFTLTVNEGTGPTGTPTPTPTGTGPTGSTTPTPTNGNGGEDDGLDLGYLPYAAAGFVAVLLVCIIALAWRWA